MAKTYPKHIERRSLLHGITTIDGWALITKDDDSKEWHIAWLEVFSRKRDALEFAAVNKWPAPFKAIRASLAVTIK